MRAKAGTWILSNIALPESAWEFVRDQVASGRFRDSNEYFVALIEADRSRQIREEIKAYENAKRKMGR